MGVESIGDVAGRMDKKQCDASPFDSLMLAALEDASADVRSRACEALQSIRGPKVATELFVNTLLQQESPSGHLVEALRNIDEERASSALGENLFHLNPDVAQRASDALIQLGGDQAFRTLFAQRRQAIEQYTDILNDADEKIMGQYNSLMRQARSAFWISLSMHGLVFALGLVLIGSAIYSVWTTESVGLAQLQGLVGVGGGFLGVILGLFYRNPIENVGKSLTRLVKVNVAFLGYTRQINQVDATFKQLFLDTSGFTVDEMKETVAQIHVVVDQSLEKIQAYLTVDNSSSGAMGSEALQELRASVSGTGMANAGES